MFRPRIIPCLLVSDGGLVKTIRFKDPTYVGDPMNAIRIFNGLEADELIILDIDAHRERRSIDSVLTQRIGSEAAMPFSVGGGITSLDQAATLINAGAEKVVICSGSATNPSLISDIAARFGSQSIIACIDSKMDKSGTYSVRVAGGSKILPVTPWEYAKGLEKSGAGEILIQSIDQDGVMNGYDLELVRKVADSVSVPVIALGGAGSYRDLKDVVTKGGAAAAAAGSLFVFQGALRGVLINYPSPAQKRALFS